MKILFGWQSTLLFFFLVSEVVIAAMLYQKWSREKTKFDFWLATLLLLFAAYLTPWMLGHANWYAKPGYRDFLFFVPFHQYFLIGPALFLFAKSITGQSASVRKHAVHFVLPLLYLLYALGVFVYDFWIADAYYFYADGLDKDFKPWYQITGSLFILAYTIAAFLIYRQYKALILLKTSFADFIRMNWLRNFLFALMGLVIFRTLFTLFNPEDGAYGIKWWYYLLFGLTTCYLAFEGLANSMRLYGLTLPGLFENNEEEQARDEEASTKTYDDTFIKTLREKLSNNYWYRDAGLNLNTLARHLDTNAAVVSRSINEGTGKNFNDFINGYRVEEVKNRIDRGDLRVTTLEAMAYEAGFNSRSTFLRAFKKHTGLTPTQYKNR